LRQRQVRVAETKFGGVTREVRIVFFARETFFLRGGNDFPVTDQRGGGVVIIRRECREWRVARP
jgi:hypothetical protein